MGGVRGRLRWLLIASAVAGCATTQAVGPVRAVPVSSTPVAVPCPEPEPSAIVGIVRGRLNKPLVGVTVVATSPALKGVQAELTNKEGRYALGPLPAGTYTVAFYYGQLVLERTGIAVSAPNGTTVNKVIDIDASEPHAVDRCAEFHTTCPGRFERSKDYVVTGQPPNSNDGRWLIQGEASQAPCH